ncbi:MAG: GTPase [Acidimicrobiia bacterium]|nr:GTPase [Acidimicrobiia bacterium]
MPTNVTPEYKKAEAEYKAAREPHDRLAALREMLRTIPKHKGTEHLQGDIKKRIKELNEELAGPKKGGARGGPATTIRPEGAAQISLLGPPNSGKSTLHDALTGSGAATGPYDFTTQYPQPGMLMVEDVGIQLIDLPPISSLHPVPWIANALQPADGAMLVVDLGHPGCVAEVQDLVRVLAERRVRLIGDWPRGMDVAEDPDDPLVKLLPTVLVAGKAHEIKEVDEELAILEELLGLHLPTLRVSVAIGELEHVGRWLFDALGVVRVYTESAAKKDDRPYTIRLGQTVIDVAGQVHKDFAAGFKYARLIRPGEPDRQVGRDYVLSDGDRIEIHV